MTVKLYHETVNEFFNLGLKNMNSSKSASETSGNLFFFALISSFVSFGIFTYSNSLIQTSSTNYLLELFRGRSKIH